ncbi:MAG: sulfatase-like hydrolase/transferase [Puniceicoccaceae bacterium]
MRSIITLVLIALPFAMYGGQKKPNIIVILADDLGYADLSCQGCEDIPTPHIDSIAESGIRFTNGYANHPVCSPSRAGLLTGRYQHRFGFENNSGPERFAPANFGVPRSEKLMSERLKVAGYATGMMGKWHIGFKEGLRPWERGFDTTYVFLSGARSFWPPKDQRNPTYLNGKVIEDETEYLTDAFARESEKFIDTNKNKPFFLYLSFNAVHAPLEASDKYQQRFPDIEDPDRKTYAGMLSAMDDAVGRVLDRLKKHDLVEDTLVFFYSDNGGPTAQTTSRNDPLRGYKGTRWEGGIRVPFMVQWPGTLPKGKVYEEMVMGFDVNATSLVAAGIKLPTDKPLDGVDLLPYLTGKNKGKPHSKLFWRSGEDRYAARVGDWKIVSERGYGVELFNLKEDIAESNNLAMANPEKLEMLQKAYKEWSGQMMKPQWIRQDSTNAEIGGKLKENPQPTRTSEQRQQILRQRFKEFDKDNSGKLTIDEFENKELFKQFDRNNNGFVTFKEVSEYYARRRAGR